MPSESERSSALSPLPALPGATQTPSIHNPHAARGNSPKTRSCCCYHGLVPCAIMLLRSAVCHLQLMKTSSDSSQALTTAFKTLPCLSLSTHDPFHHWTCRARFSQACIINDIQNDFDEPSARTRSDKPMDYRLSEGVHEDCKINKNVRVCSL